MIVHNPITATAFFSALWQDYVQMTPQASTITNSLEQRGETVQHDHVAFRTFNLHPISLEQLEPLFFDMGYERYNQPYHFESKKLDAFGYLPPSEDLPRIFLSELRVQELSQESQNIITRLVDSVDESRLKDPSVFWAGPLWKLPTYDEFQLLANESEYASWLSVIGLRANHFALYVNALNNINSIEEMNDLVEELGFEVNTSGGRVKGSKEVLLEQGSTIASTMPMTFPDNQVHDVTTCYYEYAKRYPDAEGNEYQGFVTASADKIFESTDMCRGSK